jgi:flagellar hook-associated protein 1 FlgK
MDVLGQAIGVVQNNVSNSSTAGYVTQTLNMTASPFDISGNLTGGVQSSGVESSRNVYAEQAVWSANQQVGQSTQEAASLNSLQSYFDVSGTSGVPGALSGLYAAFSSWSADPTDATSQQQVLTAATALAQSVNETANNVEQLQSQTDTQLSGTVSQINTLTSQIAQLNGEIQNGGSQDAGVQTQLYNSLEQLSNLAPITVLTASDGTATVLLGGQSPLVEGTESHSLQVTYPPSQTAPIPGGTPDAVITGYNGQNVTALANQGQLGGLLSFRNETLPSVIGDNQQEGSLNQLAQGVANTVNNILATGTTSSGSAGAPLFTYSSTSPNSQASTLSLSSTITPATLAAGTTADANGTATQLAGLSTSVEINGMTFTDFYSSVASAIGQSQSTAAANEETQGQLLSQAQNNRAQVSGVSLNEQASLLMQYQQSYQAAAQVISTVNQLTQSLLTTMQDISS